ncbi:MAG: TIGR01212 family radical SAM protein [Clostridiales bacterium]|nr:TIGR01212 family radical SAM protein [Clostridiales bacterium]
MITLSEYLIKTFGTKVYRLSLQTGCTCPNRDGTCGIDGCSFCSAGGSGEFAAPLLPIDEQIREAKKRVDAKFPKNTAPEDRRYIAYFQSYSNTYGDTKELAALFRETVSFPEISILSIATRPDVLGDEMLSELVGINKIKPVWLEFGLQTANDITAERFGRGYRTEVFDDTMRRVAEAGLDRIVHVILGLPGETREDMLNTARHIAKLEPEGVKKQNLQILKGTRLAREYAREPFHILTLDEYADIALAFLRELPDGTVVHRLTGDPPRSMITEPLWCVDKKKTLQRMNEVMNAVSRQTDSGVSGNRK